MCQRSCIAKFIIYNSFDAKGAHNHIIYTEPLILKFSKSSCTRRITDSWTNLSYLFRQIQKAANGSQKESTLSPAHTWAISFVGSSKISSSSDELEYKGSSIFAKIIQHVEYPAPTARMKKIIQHVECPCAVIVYNLNSIDSHSSIRIFLPLIFKYYCPKRRYEIPYFLQ